MVGRFVHEQTNSEDACSARLLEGKHQLNQLDQQLSDLALKVSANEKSIEAENRELKAKTDELEDLDRWKDDEVAKCREQVEAARILRDKLRRELEEMHQIARPNVTMATVAEGATAAAAEYGGPWYTDDGCETENDNKKDDVTGKMKGADFTAAVRCCSMDGKSCQTKISGQCHIGKTHAEAVEICEAIGRRLCTKAEIDAKVCCGTGCMYDSYRIWMSDRSMPQASLLELAGADTAAVLP